VQPAVTVAPGKGGAVAPGSSPFAGWADRMQRNRGRHAAITRNLYTWSSYKNWTEKVKDTWQEDPADRNPPAKKPTR